MNEFWYWWDKNVIGKPFWSFMGKVYLGIIGCGIVAYPITSLVVGSWTDSILGCLLGMVLLMLFANLAISFINLEMGSKYWDKDWDFSRNKKGGE